MPIERHDPALDGIIDTSEPVRWLDDAVTSTEIGPCEGPVWWHEENCLYFSDVRGSRRLKWSESRGVEVVATGTRGGNGLTRDRQGRLLACELFGRRVSRRESDGSLTIIAREFAGRPLNMPNDIVVKSDGSIWFTDPYTPMPYVHRTGFEQPFDAIYRLEADLSGLSMVIRDIVHPNGLCFSPDEKVLYANDYARNTIRAYNVLANGTLDLSTDRLFCNMKNDDRPGRPDGMKCDLQGNVYCGGSGGLWIIDPAGRHLGTIVHGDDKTTNLAFGGSDWKTLFFTTHTKLGCVRVKVPGVPVPRGNGVA
jgi:gluconolactonase